MGLSSVLASVRGEQYDEGVVRLACGLLSSHKSTLYIVYVIEMERGFPIDAEITPAIAKGEEVLSHMEQVASKYKCKVDGELVQAREAGTALVQEAVDKYVDTIVLGAPYRERDGSFSLGYTIPYVLKNAPCRVIVWRDPAPDLLTNGHGT